MRPGHLRNLVVWLAVLAVGAGLSIVAARPRLHFVDPAGFLVLVAVAAAGLTALLWWEKRSGEPGGEPSRDGNGQEEGR